MQRELVQVPGKAKLKGMELIAVDIFFVFHPCCRAFTGFDQSKPVPSCQGPLMVSRSVPEHLTVGCAYMISQPEWPKLESEPEPGRVPQPASEPEADFRPAARRRAPAGKGGGCGRVPGLPAGSPGSTTGPGIQSLK